MKVHFEIVDEQPKLHLWWVYIHTTPCGMHYVGVSSQEKTSQRWIPKSYKTTSLEPYIERFGWENIEHTVVAYIDHEKLALQYEDALIQEFAKQGTLINKNRSGCHYHNNPKEYMREYQREYQQSKPGKIYNRVSNYNKTHTPIETPLEAKNKYLANGYIPTYIKHDDLC